MKNTIASALALALLAGCVETADTSKKSDNRSGSKHQFEKMEPKCIARASSMTGVAKKHIKVSDEMRTGGGPLVALKVGKEPYSCRLNGDGSVTVFSEFAN